MQSRLDPFFLLVKAWHAALYLLHVVEPLPSYGYAYIGGAEVEDMLIKDAKKQLADIGEAHHIAASHQIISVGPTKHQVLHAAKEHKIDLIIVGSHGRHGLGVILGSTANAVLHGAECDVLTVRLQDVE